MSYEFPDTLPVLRAELVDLGIDIFAFKTERQAAFMIQQMFGTRFKFPPKGQSCFPVLQRLEQAVITGSVSSERRRLKSPKKTGSGRDPVSCGEIAGCNRAVPAGLVIYADGACHPNPGVGGWGFAVYRDGTEIHSDCGGDLQATNQTMELTAALMALRWFADRGVVEPVRLFSDSKYTVDGSNVWRHGWKRKGWKRGQTATVANLELWQALDEVLTLVPITLEWCKGHAGIVGNERADELSEIGRKAVLATREPTSMDLIRQQLDYSARIAP